MSLSDTGTDLLTAVKHFRSVIHMKSCIDLHVKILCYFQWLSLLLWNADCFDHPLAHACVNGTPSFFMHQRKREKQCEVPVSPPSDTALQALDNSQKN